MEENRKNIVKADKEAAQLQKDIKRNEKERKKLEKIPQDKRTAKQQSDYENNVYFYN